MPSPSSATRVEIESYRNDVLRNKIRCELPHCPVCETPSDLFRRHQARPRKFYILCETLVQTILCLVIRWRCPDCRKTFTQQPPFAFPRKRYTRESILDFSASYVEDEAATYRTTVSDEEGMPIFHPLTSKGDTTRYKSLAHSTPYRWITTLSGFKQILRGAQDLILQKNPASTVCRDLAAIEVSARKVVKAARESVLRRCRQILYLEVLFRATFLASIFPFHATKCAWG
jgi:transposase-like protein